MSSHDFGRSGGFRKPAALQRSLAPPGEHGGPAGCRFRLRAKASAPPAAPGAQVSFHNAPSRSQHFFSSSDSRGNSGAVSGEQSQLFGRNSNNVGSGGNRVVASNSGKPSWFVRAAWQRRLAAISNRNNSVSGVNRSAQGFGNSNAQSGGWQQLLAIVHADRNLKVLITAAPLYRVEINGRIPTAIVGVTIGRQSNSYSRSPLNMRQPIVTPRSGSDSNNSRGFGIERIEYQRFI